MSYLPNVPEWAEGVYQLERNDPVSGGPLRIDEKGKERGTANKPLIDLANRTAWLKQKYDTAFDNLGWMQLGAWVVGLEVSLPTQIVGFNGSWYRYRGSLDVPHIIAGESPEDDGGVWSGDNPDGVWVDVGENIIRIDLSKPAGFTIVGGVRGKVKTSEAGSLAAAIDIALANNADVLVDDTQNITETIYRQLNGKDLSIISTNDAWINFTPSENDTYYQILTFDGTGIESVLTKLKINGGKVRGVGRAVVGITVSNVYAHYENSEMRNISAGVNTVKAKIHICREARYYNVYQQLASQDWNPGIYGYGTVPIDCDLVLVDGCAFGVTGSPLDRHGVYCSSYNDGSGACKIVFVVNNTAVMRDYTTETPETSFERCFKFIGSKDVHLHNNQLVGGYGLALLTFRKHQNAECFSVSNNTARTYAAGVVVTFQDEDAQASDATWYLNDLNSSNNLYRFNCPIANISNGVEWRNTRRVTDVGSDYINDAHSSVNALAVYFSKTGRIQSESLRSTGCHYQGFQNITRESAPVYVDIDITCENAVNTASPLNATGQTFQRVRVRATDNSALWRNYTAIAIPGFSYLDAFLNEYITNVSAGIWTGAAGYAVVGLSTARPLNVLAGGRFYQTDTGTLVLWTGSLWVLPSAGYNGIIRSGTTAQISAVTKSLLGWGHTIYNVDTKKPVFFDQALQTWKYADGANM
ncbi:hypothetical protein [Candidatus Symbiopectobacterium sp. NZEC135]|uniref:hypothetical protein n=1 Tax=Candidatus Symbiopectobacterium sp. NZEC135 TaxID=2820471 RepID=UPI002226B210|nr:hypothetical protein [Candidatus Symbiopectobacterium sp. NZEC135]MCW2478823.1 hypothetical protein [Candidatus Symbiopectobacterium sp. NZEC135]